MNKTVLSEQPPLNLPLIRSRWSQGGEALPSDPRRTELYLRTMRMRCRCCGEFLSSIDALEAAARAGLPESGELCLQCQLALSVTLAELERRARRAA